MMMFFHGGYNETILFEGWAIDSIGRVATLVSSMMIVNIVTVLENCLLRPRPALCFCFFPSPPPYQAGKCHEKRSFLYFHTQQS
jgi:hypothetical protein